MDSKALAKSKRAHSLHHSKKSHPKPKPKPNAKPTLTSAGSSKGTPEKPPQLRQPWVSPALPSNWERYEEGLDSDAETPSGEVPGPSSEVPPPKSKGADYRHLIAEARAQPRSQSEPFVDIFPSMDDILPDFFNKGTGSLLSARGEAVVSVVQNDSFVIDEDAAVSHEVPFFSLNLNLLAEQLSKVDLAKRLFIEEDLLPPELLREASASSSGKESAQAQAGKTEEVTKHLSRFNLNGTTGEETKQNEYIRGTTSQKPTIAPESSKQSSAVIMTELKTEPPSTLKTAAAEAELDALLDSFTDTKLADTFDFNTSRSSLTSEAKGSKILHQTSRKGWESFKAGAAPTSANIDVLLDDLLEETSNLTKPNGLGGTESSVSKISSRSKVLDDFDSWLDTI